MSTKFAIVTGAGSGIGRHVAIALSQNGYQVGLVGRRIKELERTAELAAVNRCFTIRCDITKQVEIDHMLERVVGTWGRLDLLFNNAGINLPATELGDLSLQEWQRVLDVNLTGSFLCTQSAFRQMKKQRPQGGRIINNGSVSSQSPRPHSAAYTASKYAITGLTRATALDGRPYNIACGQIDIGNAGTDMTTKMSQGVLQANGSIATEPTIDVNSVAQAVLYMASLPLDTNVLSMTVMATQMPFVGRG